MKTNLFVLLSFCATIILHSKGISGDGRTSSRKLVGNAKSTLININNISAWYEANGQQERTPFTGNAGVTYPRKTSTSIYASGLLWGGKVNDGITPVTRVNGVSYSVGLVPGAILGFRTGIIEDPTDSSKVGIWRIRRDYSTADLTQDAAEFFIKPLATVTKDDIDLIRAQYKIDWENWPASKGAPFYDANNDGIYTPQFETIGDKETPKLFPVADEPGLADADQVVWYVANDIGGASPWASPHIGMEMQTTIWGYNRPGNFGEIIFKKFKLIYKGTASTPANATIEKMYITHWTDADLGEAGNDFAGCDTLLSLGYVYNGYSVDNEYKKFSLAPPAYGFDFLQGPIVPGTASDTAVFDLKKRPGFKNLPMTSFIYFAAGGLYTDPGFNATGGLEWYQMMQGYPPRPSGVPLFMDPISSQQTKYWLSGNPVSGTGWVDGILEGAGDRRFLQTSGPFTMALRDTQEIVIGSVGGSGSDRLSSILKMKENDRYVQSAYNSLFTFIPPGFVTNVTYPNSSQGKISIQTLSSINKMKSIEISLFSNEGVFIKKIDLLDDGLHNDGSASDGIFGATTTIARRSAPVNFSAHFIDNGGKSYSVDKIVENITIAGPVDVPSATINFDNINNDGLVNNGEFVRFGIMIKNNTEYSLNKIEAYTSIRTDIISKAIDIPKGAEYVQSDADAQFEFRLPLDYDESSYTVHFIIKDSAGNFWNPSYTFPVYKESFLSDTLHNVAENVVGENDAQVGYVLYNPLIKGDKIEIWYGGYNTIRNWTAIKTLSTTYFATESATLTAKNMYPWLDSVSNGKGYGTFTISETRDRIAYIINVEGLSGSITSAHIHVGTDQLSGPIVKTLSFTENTSSGIWFKSDATEPFSDSLVKYFTAGNLYIVVHTTAYPDGEIRGQIADGLLPRKELPNPQAPMSSLFSYEENRLTGYSLYVSPAPFGTKSVNQTEPTIGNVLSHPNPEGTYQIIGPRENLTGAVPNNLPIEIRFNNEINYAAAVRGDTVNPPSLQAKFIKVPFAIYIDTTRVWPVILNKNSRDTLWNTDSNVTHFGKPVFDRISVLGTKTPSGYDVNYYSPFFTEMPPAKTVQKINIINGANHVSTNIYFVNEKGDSIPPATGTKVLFAQYQPIKVGDIKSFTLQMLGVEKQPTATLLLDYSLSQNYPNPFNPTTKIEFALPKAGKVILKVYDIIGREITTLVNEQLGAGKYSVQFNAARFASGVYFYRITAGNFVKIKKMILLK